MRLAHQCLWESGYRIRIGRLRAVFLLAVRGVAQRARSSEESGMVLLQWRIRRGEMNGPNRRADRSKSCCVACFPDIAMSMAEAEDWQRAPVTATELPMEASLGCSGLSNGPPSQDGFLPGEDFADDGHLHRRATRLTGAVVGADTSSCLRWDGPARPSGPQQTRDRFGTVVAGRTVQYADLP